MDKLFIYLTLGIGAVAIAIVLYFIIQNLYLRLKLFANNWIRSHPNEVTEIKIKLDDLSCAIERQVERIKLRLTGERRAGGSIVIDTGETITRRQIEALYKRELNERQKIAVAV